MAPRSEKTKRKSSIRANITTVTTGQLAKLFFRSTFHAEENLSWVHTGFRFRHSLYVWLFKALIKHNPEATKGFLKVVGQC